MKLYQLTYYYKNRYVTRFIKATSEAEVAEKAPKSATEVHVVALVENSGILIAT